MIDPLNHMTEGGKTVMDVTASMGFVVTAISHWADVLTPIVTLLIALATLAWWGVRWWDWFAKRRAE